MQYTNLYGITQNSVEFREIKPIPYKIPYSAEFQNGTSENTLVANSYDVRFQEVHVHGTVLMFMILVFMMFAFLMFMILMFIIRFNISLVIFS